MGIRLSLEATRCGNIYGSHSYGYHVMILVEMATWLPFCRGVWLTYISGADLPSYLFHLPIYIYIKLQQRVLKAALQYDVALTAPSFAKDVFALMLLWKMSSEGPNAATPVQTFPVTNSMKTSTFSSPSSLCYNPIIICPSKLDQFQVILQNQSTLVE